MTNLAGVTDEDLLWAQEQIRLHPDRCFMWVTHGMPVPYGTTEVTREQPMGGDYKLASFPRQVTS